MLTTSRTIGQQIQLLDADGHPLAIIRLTKITGSHCAKISIDAPPEVKILRAELTTKTTTKEESTHEPVKMCTTGAV